MTQRKATMERKAYLSLTSLENARKLLLDAFAASPLDAETISLRESQGRTLARNAIAAISSPAYHGAAMDGIATRAEQTYGASERRPKALRIGENAHWINTGQPLPPGCNCVIMVEHLVTGRDAEGNEQVTIEKAAFPWQHVRKLGEDMVATEILLPAGTLIGPYEMGAMAATGVYHPTVFRKPLIALIPTGSEMVAINDVTPELLSNGRKLPEFNSIMLAAMIREAGGESSVHAIVPDAPDKIREALLSACKSAADLIVINAGSSAGSKDFTAEIVAELGELWVHGISIMPGKPTVIGAIRGKPVLGIPGYPVSAAMAFEQLALPLLAHWQGRTPPQRPEALASPVQALPSRPGMEEFIRVKLGRVGETLQAVPLPRGAGAVSSLSRADAIMHVPADAEGLPAEAPARVSFLRTPAMIDKALLAIGSHDSTLDLLDSLLRRHRPGLSLTSAHVGSLSGLMALKAGRCHLCGTHLLGRDGIYNQEAIKEHLPDTPVKLVRLVDREQGLIVKPGNPLRILSLTDLPREGIQFVNRQRGSGTRVLLDWKLGKLGLLPDDIAGYEDEEYTHMNVAAAVLSGRASAGLGVKSAAVALGLDFIPVGVEEYDLAIPLRFWDDERIQELLEVIRSPEFRATAENMGGYGLKRTGEVVWSSGD